MAQPRIVIVGAGFAGYQTARTLSRLAGRKAEIILLNPTDHFFCICPCCLRSPQESWNHPVSPSR